MNTNQKNLIGFADHTLQNRAQLIADRFNLILSNDTLPRLNVTTDKLVLLSEQFTPLFVDFCSDSVKKRRDEGKKQGLVRACKPAPGVHILDTTAGWGRDAAVLASFGADVLMLERQPMMAALLSDALERLNQDSSPTSSRAGTLSLQLQHVDAKYYLQHLAASDYPDVIYIDPMHPLRQKSALVKKDMQVLQNLLGADEDIMELIQLARTRKKSRVVVKWPQRLAPLFKPNLSIEGKTIRFDVFL